MLFCEKQGEIGKIQLWFAKKACFWKKVALLLKIGKKYWTFCVKCAIIEML
jgi:hypothetical protein